MSTPTVLEAYKGALKAVELLTQLELGGEKNERFAKELKPVIDYLEDVINRATLPKWPMYDALVDEVERED